MTAPAARNGQVPKKKRLLTGLRPTGQFHLGNYVGTLEKDVELQNAVEYECFFLIADYHSLTTGYQNSHEIGDNIREALLDFLAVGIDPEREHDLPAVAHPGGRRAVPAVHDARVGATRAQRIPTLKEQVRDLKLESASLGSAELPGAAGGRHPDGARRGRAGRQGPAVAHRADARDRAPLRPDLRRPVFPEPEGLVARIPTLPGTDGSPKMSKSIGNLIYAVRRRRDRAQEGHVDVHRPDPAARHRPRARASGNPVFVYHDAFNPDLDEVQRPQGALYQRQGRRRRGQAEARRRAEPFLDPIRERRAEYERQPGLLEDIIAEGSRRARLEARETLRLASEAMGLNYFATARAPRRSQPAIGASADAIRVVYPSLAELGQMAAIGRATRPSIARSWPIVETPVSALLKLGAGPGSFLLESVEGGEFVARYSFVAAGLERSLAIYDDHAVYAAPRARPS